MYTGITKQPLESRYKQHIQNGKNFKKLDYASNKLQRNKARALEEMFINNGPYNNENKIHSISPKSKYYKHALKWAESMKDKLIN